MPMFVGSQSFISLPSFMFVSAVVTEIRELKEKEKEKKNSEMDYLTPFLGTLFLTRGTFEHMYRFNLLEVPYITN